TRSACAMADSTALDAGSSPPFRIETVWPNADGTATAKKTTKASSDITGSPTASGKRSGEAHFTRVTCRQAEHYSALGARSPLVGREEGTGTMRGQVDASRRGLSRPKMGLPTRDRKRTIGQGPRLRERINLGPDHIPVVL